MKTPLLRTALTGAFLFVPGLAMAHPGPGDHAGFAHGFIHPIGGLDHVLAMVMVGLFAAQLGGRALWRVPAAFLSVMALGGLLGAAGVSLPFVEIGIALSIVVLGAAVALGARAPVAAAMGLVGVFALFHGHAHGAEMPESAGGYSYAAGFLAATALLHGAGMAAWLLAGRAGRMPTIPVIRAAGALAAVAGIGILAGAL